MNTSSSLNLGNVSFFPITTTLQRSSNSTSYISCRASTLDTQRPRRSLYEVLSLESEKVGFGEIKKAYRSMARQYHPDVVHPTMKEESTRRFVELQQAYETLSDPTLRQEYDYELGLGYLSGLGVKRVRSGSNYNKQRWEDQLLGLESKSHIRTCRKKHR